MSHSDCKGVRGDAASSGKGGRKSREELGLGVIDVGVTATEAAEDAALASPAAVGGVEENAYAAVGEGKAALAASDKGAEAPAAGESVDRLPEGDCSPKDTR